MAILSIETSTAQCSVALHNCNGTFIAQKNAAIPNAHSEQLGCLIEEILCETNISVKNLKAVAISEGPGSYTGLRIGTSLSKGICFALSIPLIAVDTLQALALAIKEKINSELPENSIFVPMIDARRMEIYTAQWNLQNQQIQATNACIIDSETHEQFSENSHFFIGGDGSDKCVDFLCNSHIEHVKHVVNQAKNVGEIACKLFEKQQFANTAYFDPLYLKEFQTTQKKQIL